MKTQVLTTIGRTIVTTINDRWFRFCVGIVTLLSAPFAFADDPTIGGQTFGSVAEKVQSEASEVKDMLWTVAQVAGVAIAIFALISWKKASNPEYSGRITHGTAIIMFIIGCLLFFLPMFMGIGATSFLGN